MVLDVCGYQTDKERILLALQCIGLTMLNYTSQNPFPIHSGIDMAMCDILLKVSKAHVEKPLPCDALKVTAWHQAQWLLGMSLLPCCSSR